MDFYQAAFLVLISGCVVMSYKQYQNEKTPSAERKPLLQDDDSPEDIVNVVIDSKAKSAANRFSWLFLTVYSLVMAADWLQGI